MAIVLRFLVAAAVVATLWYGALNFSSFGGDWKTDWDARYQFDVPQAEAMKAIEALQFSPSHLAGMGVTAARPQVERQGDAAIAFFSPPAEQGDKVRFTFKFSPLENGSK